MKGVIYMFTNILVNIYNAKSNTYRKKAEGYFQKANPEDPKNYDRYVQRGRKYLIKRNNVLNKIAKAKGLI
jgi:hypothetical protein